MPACFSSSSPPLICPKSLFFPFFYSTRIFLTMFCALSPLLTVTCNLPCSIPNSPDVLISPSSCKLQPNYPPCQIILHSVLYNGLFVSVYCPICYLFSPCPAVPGMWAHLVLLKLNVPSSLSQTA
jgi:hypothetical protein